jgi:hypothetical protein
MLEVYLSVTCPEELGSFQLQKCIMARQEADFSATPCSQLRNCKGLGLLTYFPLLRKRK